ncbi:MAG: sugar ABC transporter ATP-binding protein [Armatimonadetes bacterium]|nr:sugar ABC transporter ATP-binding protein [Armatimonadota bacterium]
MIAVGGVSKWFGETHALTDISLSVEPGLVTALVGENGSGKSTLLRTLVGELKADKGSITWGGKPYSPGDERVFLVHQELALCPHLSVGENIFLGKFGSGMLSPTDLQAKAHGVLTELGYPDLDPAETVNRLPISLRQVVEIARAQARNAEVILYDEPTSSLTRQDIARLFDLIRRQKEQGKSILYVSHFLDEVREIADRIVVLRDGYLVSQGAMVDLPDDEIVRLMVGREVKDMFPRSERTAGEVVLTAESIEGSRGLPKSTTMSLRRGMVLGISGLNGSGRTELLRALMGLDKTKSGTVQVCGMRVRSVAQRLRIGMGMVSEDRKAEGLALNLSIEENITMARRWSPWIRPKEIRDRAEAAASEFAVKCSSYGQVIGHLSGGNQQKAAIARLLDAECDILLLDEPTRGIDVGSKAAIYQQIDRLALQGKAILLVSSYLPELLGVCDQIAVMNRGVLSQFVPAQSATQESLMELSVR